MRNFQNEITGRFLKNSLLMIMLIAPTCCIIYSQESQIAAPVVKLSGYVKSDFFFDSRQNICAREGHFLLLPSPPSYDENNLDINAKSSFNTLPVQSNLAVNVAGPKVMGASVSALIEGDFFGQSNSDVNMLRLRHAYIKLSWEKTEIITGQYWHPAFALSCYPSTISFNTGAPINPFSRAPQVRITQTVGILKFSGSLLSQRDYVSVGPEGPNSKYLRDSGIPEIVITAETNTAGKFLLGAVLGYKTLVPQIKTGSNFNTSESVRGITANIFMKYSGTVLLAKLAGIYLENGSELISISGYAVKDTIDALKGIVTYEPVRTISCWGELQTCGKLIQAGIFSGYSQNMGTKSAVTGPFYLTSGALVKSLYRVSPRLSIKQGNLTLAAELEYTSALYGSPDNHGIMIQTTRVANTRLLLSAIYKF
jgi:hypothetical protein